MGLSYCTSALLSPSAPMETEEEGEEEGPQVPTVNRSNKPTYNALSTSLGGR